MLFTLPAHIPLNLSCGNVTQRRVVDAPTDVNINVATLALLLGYHSFVQLTYRNCWFRPPQTSSGAFKEQFKAFYDHHRSCHNLIATVYLVDSF